MGEGACGSLREPRRDWHRISCSMLRRERPHLRVRVDCNTVGSIGHPVAERPRGDLGKARAVGVARVDGGGARVRPVDAATQRVHRDARRVGRVRNPPPSKTKREGPALN